MFHLNNIFVVYFPIIQYEYSFVKLMFIFPQKDKEIKRRRTKGKA